jgi:hypothetical protein|tara:strand:- start:6970 stop:13572 length:6603 start_codon:yes stop_codon:yes gene_type:complete
MSNIQICDTEADISSVDVVEGDEAVVKENNAIYRFFDLSTTSSFSYDFDDGTHLKLDSTFFDFLSLGVRDSFSIEFWMNKNTADDFSIFDIANPRVSSILDFSSDSHTITQYGRTQAVKHGPYKNGSSSLFFDSSLDFITVDSSLDSMVLFSPFTIEFWYRKENSATNDTVFAVMDKFKDILVLDEEGIIVNGVQYTSTASSLDAKTWTHNALTFDGFNYELWKNGDSVELTRTPDDGGSVKYIIDSGFMNIFTMDRKVPSSWAVQTTMSPTDKTLFYMGGAVNRVQLQTINSGADLKLSAGGADGPSLIVPAPADTDIHTISWDVNTDPGRVRLWIDSNYQGSNSINKSLPARQWALTSFEDLSNATFTNSPSMLDSSTRNRSDGAENYNTDIFPYSTLNDEQDGSWNYYYDYPTVQKLSKLAYTNEDCTVDGEQDISKVTRRSANLLNTRYKYSTSRLKHGYAGFPLWCFSSGGGMGGDNADGRLVAKYTMANAVGGYRPQHFYDNLNANIPSATKQNIPGYTHADGYTPAYDIKHRQQWWSTSLYWRWMPQFQGYQNVGNNRYFSGGTKNRLDDGTKVTNGFTYNPEGRVQLWYFAAYYTHINKYPEAFDLGYRRPDRWYTDDYLPLAAYTGANQTDVSGAYKSVDFLAAPALRNECKPAPLGSIFLSEDTSLGKNNSINQNSWSVVPANWNRDGVAKGDASYFNSLGSGLKFGVEATYKVKQTDGMSENIGLKQEKWAVDFIKTWHDNNKGQYLQSGSTPGQAVGGLTTYWGDRWNSSLGSDYDPWTHQEIVDCLTPASVEPAANGSGTRLPLDKTSHVGGDRGIRGDLLGGARVFSAGNYSYIDNVSIQKGGTKSYYIEIDPADNRSGHPSDYTGMWFAQKAIFYGPELAKTNTHKYNRTNCPVYLTLFETSKIGVHPYMYTDGQFVSETYGQGANSGIDGLSYRTLNDNSGDINGGGAQLSRPIDRYSGNGADGSTGSWSSLRRHRAVHQYGDHRYDGNYLDHHITRGIYNYKRPSGKGDMGDGFPTAPHPQDFGSIAPDKFVPRGGLGDDGFGASAYQTDIYPIVKDFGSERVSYIISEPDSRIYIFASAAYVGYVDFPENDAPYSIMLKKGEKIATTDGTGKIPAVSNTRGQNRGSGWNNDYGEGTYNQFKVINNIQPYINTLKKDALIIDGVFGGLGGGRLGTHKNVGGVITNMDWVNDDLEMPDSQIPENQYNRQASVFGTIRPSQWPGPPHSYHISGHPDGGKIVQPDNRGKKYVYMSAALGYMYQPVAYGARSASQYPGTTADPDDRTFNFRILNQMMLSIDGSQGLAPAEYLSIAGLSWPFSDYPYYIETRSAQRDQGYGSNYHRAQTYTSLALCHKFKRGRIFDNFEHRKWCVHSHSKVRLGANSWQLDPVDLVETIPSADRNASSSSGDGAFGMDSLGDSWQGTLKSNLLYSPQMYSDFKDCSITIAEAVRSNRGEQTGLQYATDYVAKTGGSIVHYSGGQNTDIKTALGGLSEGDALVLPTGKYEVSASQTGTQDHYKTKTSIFFDVGFLICGTTDNPNDVELKIKVHRIFDEATTSNTQLAFMNIKKAEYHSYNPDIIFKSAHGIAFKCIFDFNNKDIGWRTYQSSSDAGSSANIIKFEGCIFTNYKSWLVPNRNNYSSYKNSKVNVNEIIIKDCIFQKDFGPTYDLLNPTNSPTFEGKLLINQGTVDATFTTGNAMSEWYIDDYAAGSKFRYIRDFIIHDSNKYPLKYTIDSAPTIKDDSSTHLILNPQIVDTALSYSTDGVITHGTTKDKLHNVPYTLGNWFSTSLNYSGDSNVIRTYIDGIKVDSSSINLDINSLISTDNIMFNKKDSWNPTLAIYEDIYGDFLLKEFRLTRNQKRSGDYAAQFLTEFGFGDKLTKEPDDVFLTAHDGSSILANENSPYTADVKSWRKVGILPNALESAYTILIDDNPSEQYGTGVFGEGANIDFKMPFKTNGAPTADWQYTNADVAPRPQNMTLGLVEDSNYRPIRKTMPIYESDGFGGFNSPLVQESSGSYIGTITGDDHTYIYQPDSNLAFARPSFLIHLKDSDDRGDSIDWTYSVDNYKSSILQIGHDIDNKTFYIKAYDISESNMHRSSHLHFIGKSVDSENKRPIVNSLSRPTDSSATPMEISFQYNGTSGLDISWLGDVQFMRYITLDSIPPDFDSTSMIFDPIVSSQTGGII